MLEDVLRAFFPFRRAGIFLACAALTAGTAVRADDVPKASPGYKMVPIKMGGKTGYIQVRETPNMYGHIKNSSNGNKSDPENFSFNTTSPMANKTYLPESSSDTQRTGAYQDKVQSSFITKSYFPERDGKDNEGVPGLHSEVAVNAAEGFDHGASGFDKSFNTGAGGTAEEQDKTAELGAGPASESGRSAVLGGHDIQRFAYADADKTYTGPETLAVKRDLNRMNSGLESLKDLPDRPLTIDEVRALINHGVEPDLTKKPAASTVKPLNDPDYMPDAAPAPNRAPIDLRDDNDVPAPGTIAHPEEALTPPENAEPLPTK
jgi:hypothetical protein